MKAKILINTRFYYLLAISDSLRKVRTSTHTFPQSIGSSEVLMKGLIKKEGCREEVHSIAKKIEVGF